MADGNHKEELALTIVRRLREAGFTAVLAGGCVRDKILGLTPKDYDIATDAHPETVQGLFERTVAVGARFGVIVVILGEAHFEVATFRADGGYFDGRRPVSVRYGTIEEDARRRDFTIGGMYYDPFADRVIDLVGGLRDLRAGVIRAIGSPDERIAEDRLRVLRAVRFAARLRFAIDPATLAAVRRAAPRLDGVSSERIGEEMAALMTQGSVGYALDLMLESGLMAAVIPEALEMIGCSQPLNFHPEGDVWTHTRLALSMLPAGCTETLAFGVLFHDIAKPRCRVEAPDGKMTFYGHTEQGAAMAAAILERLRRSRATQERVAYLVRDHLRLCMAPRMRAATLKRMLAEDGFAELLELARLDALSSSSYLGFYHFCRRAMAVAPEELRPPRLLRGDDLIDMGMRPGPRFKTILKRIEDLQLDGALTTRAAALDYVREHFATEA